LRSCRFLETVCLDASDKLLVDEEDETEAGDLREKRSGVKLVTGVERDIHQYQGVRWFGADLELLKLDNI